MAWHIRARHTASRYYVGFAKEHERNHECSCPFVTWAFRQSQALAQMAAKQFWHANKSQQKYLNFLHMEESLTSTNTDSNGRLTSWRWELEKKHSFAPWIFRRDSEKPPSLLGKTPFILDHTKLSSWRAKHEPHKHHGISSPPQVPGDHHVPGGIAQRKPIWTTHHANK